MPILSLLYEESNKYIYTSGADGYINIIDTTNINNTNKVIKSMQ